MVDTLTMWIESLMSTAWVYPVIGAVIFGDSFIPVLPSEIPLNLVGAWSGARGEPNIGLMFIVAVMCAVVGDNLCFLLGTRLMPYVNRIRRGSKTYGALVWVKRNMRRNAGAAIIIARFIPSARLLLTILLGSVRFPWPMFFIFDTLGVILWAAQALAIGYLGGVIFSGSPLFAMLLSVVLATVLGFLVQRTQNKIMDALDVRRGYAEAHN